jgi:pimeloyl-ACP methyl ester carboxylesterase
MDYIYLHGFASSPRSTKAKALSDRFRRLNLTLHIPDLNQGNFFHLTLTRQIHQVEAILPLTPVTLMGSSLGGLTAAWLAERNPQIQRLVLLAPAFEFLLHWLPRIGAEQLQQWRTQQTLPIYHYASGQERNLSYKFLQDAEQYSDAMLQRAIPTLILHGLQDEVIPIQASREFAAQRPWVELIELSSDHGLTDNLEEVWQATLNFCQLPPARSIA